MRVCRTTIVRLAVTGAALVAGLTPAAAQGPAPAALEAGAPAPAAPPPAGYAYDADGRRDPFVSLLVRGTDTRSVSQRPAGLPGLLVGEVVVKGIVQDRSRFIGMVQGPSTRTFIIRSGERLMDGSVKAITADSVVFSQDVTDPLSTVKQKEVRKTVRPADGERGSGAGDR